MCKSELLGNIDRISTTELGVERIQRNLGLPGTDVVAWCKARIADADDIVRKGKNWYVQTSGAIITTNASSFTIITAHKAK
ncbi:MAG: DUF3781 domain-containing protein [Defluviitaleaceae bacterium]|nr:DUF3781 domain-containing protein [Defluviitaleaceae bacterium]